MAWLLTFHILGFIVWLGALLDLTRILGYHVKEELQVQARLSAMEFRMFFFVATPGLAITLIFGTLLFFTGGGVSQYLVGHGWFHAKLTLVIVLFVIHYFVGKEILKLRAAPKQTSPVRFKILHGVAALVMIFILILVMVKPF
jgi:protoporphyrinogen IX oxidase